jgi:signal transduction histidine kinase
VNRRASTRWLLGPIFGINDLGVWDIALALFLGAFGVALTGGLVKTGHPHGGLAASLAVLLMTVPVVYARRQPVAAAGTLAAGGLVNWLAIGHMVRCGPSLPAVFYVAFTLGSRRDWRVIWPAMALLTVNLVSQVLSDPNLATSPPGGTLALVVPMTVAFLFAGHLLRKRNTAVAGLRARAEELRQQREQNARLAVTADRSRIAGDLDPFLHEQVQVIATAASEGRATLEVQPDQAQTAFAAIQKTGRATLAHMRGVVGHLKEEGAPTPSRCWPSLTVCSLKRPKPTPGYR